MSTFQLPNTSPPCPVNLTPDLSKDQLLAFHPFKEWIKTLSQSLKSQESQDHPFHVAPYKLRQIDIQAVDFFGDQRIGFIKLRAKVSNDDGEQLPGAVFLRGGSVGMLLILQPDDVPAESDDEKYVILTLQPRIAAGSLSMAELPAGMLDDSGTFAGGAAKEIEEETGLKVEEHELIDLTKLSLSGIQPAGEHLQEAVFPSCGGSDEYIPLFLHEKRLPRDQMQEFQGKLTGLRDEKEKITLKLVPLKNLWKEGGRDAKALSALALYNALRNEGRL
ncbi:hypothetical protein M501DRAFT_939098 [Patellaria atrata CBS 101060]|uniref:Nudix hydrolase domain-containing protein n=1 Tax=Patellaria atrata CBS 101060 TaxID=1346257 RepID=A0A9P4S7X5_9PEZI|nr:hypothetical protein M501DRAFT_939098 [Patellaria atrata CBS 101060]